MLRDKYANEIDALLARFPQKKSAVLHLMHLAQNEYGYMSDAAMREVADILDLTRPTSRRWPVSTSLFYEEPTGRHVLEICNDLACALRGRMNLWRWPRASSTSPWRARPTMVCLPLKTVMCLGPATARRCPMQPEVLREPG